MICTFTWLYDTIRYESQTWPMWPAQLTRGTYGTESADVQLHIQVLELVRNGKNNNFATKNTRQRKSAHSSSMLSVRTCDLHCMYYFCFVLIFRASKILCLVQVHLVLPDSEFSSRLCKTLSPSSAMPVGCFASP